MQLSFLHLDFVFIIQHLSRALFQIIRFRNFTPFY